MILEEQNGKIQVTDIARSMPEVIALKKNGAEYFENAITYIFWMHADESIYKEMLHSQRKLYICKRHLDNANPDDYEKNEDVQRFIELYDDIQLSREERLRKSIQKDMDDLLTRITHIKFTKEVRVEIEVEENGETKKKRVMQEVDNTKEKLEALQSAKTLLQLSKDLDVIIKANIKNKKTEVRKRLYDRLPKKIKK